MFCCHFDGCSDKALSQLMLNIVASFTLGVDTKTFSGLEMIDKKDEVQNIISIVYNSKLRVELLQLIM